MNCLLMLTKVISHSLLTESVHFTTPIKGAEQLYRQTIPEKTQEERVIAGVPLSVLLLYWTSPSFYSLVSVAASQFPLQFILTHAGVPLAVQVRLTSQMHHGIEQQSHRRLTSCQDGEKEPRGWTWADNTQHWTGVCFFQKDASDRHLFT